MNNITKKIVASVTVLTCAVWMMGPGVAQALTVDQLLTLIAGASSLEDLQADIAAAQAAEEEGAVTIEGVPADFTFETNLALTSTGDDVKYLQIVLNSDSDTQLAASGVGSSGNETSYFGPLTKAAVIKFQELYAEDCLASWGLTTGTGFVGSTTRAKLNAILTAGVVTPPTGCTTDADCLAGYTCTAGACVQIPVAAGLTVALSADTPAATALIAGQALAELARFTFTNGDSTEVKVTKIVLNRIGISADTTLSAVYLYDGVKRLTEMASVSAGKITFVNTVGIFTVPAGGSKTISVKSNILAESQGQTVGVTISAAANVESNATAVSGTFPLSGNLMSIATATLATVGVGATGITTANVDAGSIDYTVWQSTLIIGERTVNLRSLQLRQIGSIRVDDLQNFRLFVKGVEKATASLAADNTLTFDLSALPVALTTGTAAIEVRADVISGSARTFSFALWRASDLDVQDSEFNVNVLATGTFPVSAPQTGTTLVGVGSMTVTRAADSPTGLVVVNASDVVLAKYTLAAFGESVRVERLKVDGPTSIGSSTTVTLRNGRLVANGVQVGSTAGIVTDTGTTYELGAALVVVPGSPATLEVRADIFDSETTNEVVAGTTILLSLATSTNNAQTLESLTLLNVGGNTEANTLTVASGQLVLAKNAAFGNQAVVAGTNNVKIGSFVLQSGSAETVNISNYQVGITVDGNKVALTELSNLRISESTLVRGPVASTNNFAVTQTMVANSTKTIDVFVDISSAAALPSTGGTIIPSLAVTAIGATTGNNLSVTAVTGQTMTVEIGALTMTRDVGTPIPAIIIGGTTTTVVKYRFDATNESFAIIEAKVAIMKDADINAVTQVKIGTLTAPLVVAADATLVQNGTGLTTTQITVTGLSERFKVGQKIILTPTGDTLIGGLPDPVTVTIATIPDDADTLTFAAIGTITGGTTATVTPINGTATFTGLILSVPKDGNAIMAVEATFNTVAPGAGESGDTPIFSLTSYRSQSASGTLATVLYGVSPLTVANADSNLMVLRKTAPTATLNTAALSNALGGIDHEVLKVDIAANAAEDVDIREIRVTPTITGTITGGAGIAVFQGAIERGRVMNLSSTATVAGTACTSLAVTTGDGVKFQIGQKVDLPDAQCTGIGTITNIVTDTLTVSGFTWVAVGTVAITPVGYTTANTYRIPLTTAVIAKSTSSLFTVKADTTGLTTAGNSIQIRILIDAAAGTTGNLIWREGTVATDINGYLVTALPITGPALIRP